MKSPTIPKKPKAKAKQLQQNTSNYGLLAKGRILIFSILITMTGGVIFLYSSSASTLSVTGRVYDVRTNLGIAGVIIFGCNNNGSTHTNTNGYWQFPISSGQGYCARVESGIPSGWTGPSNNNQPEHASSATYEGQIAGENCYHNPSCNGIIQTWDRPVDSNVDFRYSSPAPPPQPTPTPTPTPNPTPSINHGSSPRTSHTNNSSAPSTPDTTPPAAPTGLIANVDNEKQVVSLIWQAASDNVAVQTYQIERSLDQQNWSILTSNNTNTNYDDSSIQFGTHYFYRVAALDTSGNISGYASADVTTGSFQPNLNPDFDTNLSSSDKIAKVTIPGGAVSTAAYCTLSVSLDSLPPNFSGYKFISGPYNLECRDLNSTVITNFNKPLKLTVHLSKSAVKGVSTVTYFGHNDNNSWQILVVTSHDKKQFIDIVKLNNFRTFVVMGKQKKSSFWVTIFKIFVIIAILLALTRFIARQILKRRVQNQNEDYHRKAEGL